MTELLAERTRELTAFALEKLPSMRLTDGAFCWEVAAPGLHPSGRSLRYTLMCLLGLQRARDAGFDVPIDPGELRGLVLDEIDSAEMGVGEMGLLLWADSRMGSAALDAIAYRLHAHDDIRALEGLELSWVVIGAAQAGATDLFERALAEQLRRAETPSGLFRHLSSGRRARFPNFATQIYGVLACTYAARAGRDDALAAGTRAAEVLLGLQREDGGWPWIFDNLRGRVVEPYEVYSVHQDAMAPMALRELSEVGGDPRFGKAAEAGVEWIFGANELGRPLLDRRVGILYRSIRRRRPLDRGLLYANTALSSAGVRTSSQHASTPGLGINRTDRPYHLGWVLEAWCSR